MQTPIGTFEVEDSFYITGRGLVLMGKVASGQVAPGCQLAFKNSIRWNIKGVESISVHNEYEKIGLLCDVPFASREELLQRGIMWNIAQIFAQQTGPTPMLRLVRTTSENPDFQQLVQLLDRDLAARDGDEAAFYAQYNKIVHIRHVVVAYQGAEPVGCGAFKEFEPGAVEIKRMYVQPAHRQQGVAQAVLGELERWAHELGYPTAVLETGRRQPEAIALYQRCGYVFTENYGQYVGVANSVCFRKALSQ